MISKIATLLENWATCLVSAFEVKLHAHRLMILDLNGLMPVAWNALERLRFGAHWVLNLGLCGHLPTLGNLMNKSLCLLLRHAALRLLAQLTNMQRVTWGLSMQRFFVEAGCTPERLLAAWGERQILSHLLIVGVLVSKCWNPINYWPEILIIVAWCKSKRSCLLPLY
jgi:hypothetical protein